MNNVLFIDPGQLTCELALESLQPEPDGMGGYQETWTEIAMLWGGLSLFPSASVISAHVPSLKQHTAS